MIIRQMQSQLRQSWRYDICSCDKCSKMVNVNVKHNPNPNPIPNPYHNLNPYPSLNQKPNHYPHSNSLLLEISSQEQLPPEQMLDHRRVKCTVHKKHLLVVYWYTNHTYMYVHFITAVTTKFKYQDIAWKILANRPMYLYPCHFVNKGV